MNLKPCPFCGGEIRIVRLHGSYGEPWYARCDRCEVSGYYYKTEDQAIEEWSVRPERTCKDATSEEHTQAFTCSECGCWVAYDEYWETGIYVQGDGQAVHIHPHYCPNCGAKVVSE